MIKVNVTKKKSKSKSIFRKDLEITVVNNLEINLNCDVEVLGNQITIWINKKEE